jgi:hypothetical protein
MSEFEFKKSLFADPSRCDALLSGFEAEGGSVHLLGIEYVLYQRPDGEIIRYQNYTYEARLWGHSTSYTGTELAKYAAVVNFYADHCDYRPWEW